MSDLMTFPDTVEEFMEQYKVTDTEQVYSNGAEYVPIFRMKQWFEHLLTAETEIVRCKDCLMHGVCRFEQGLGLDGYCSQAERRSNG